jgi:hypothetical protein
MPAFIQSAIQPAGCRHSLNQRSSRPDAGIHSISDPAGQMPAFAQSAIQPA